MRTLLEYFESSVATFMNWHFAIAKFWMRCCRLKAIECSNDCGTVSGKNLFFIILGNGRYDENFFLSVSNHEEW